MRVHKAFLAAWVYAPRPMSRRRATFAPILAATAALFALCVGGCQAKIGDSCTRSIDCSLQNDRVCDLSEAFSVGKGECTIDGCGRNSCPKEAACVKTYGSDFLSVTCDPEREDRAVVASDGSVLAPRNDCFPHEICLGEGLCADEVSARTSCRLECKSNKDCRDAYECRLTGSRGVYQAPDPVNPSDTSQKKVCMRRE